MPELKDKLKDNPVLGNLPSQSKFNKLTQPTAPMATDLKEALASHTTDRQAAIVAVASTLGINPSCVQSISDRFDTFTNAGQTISIQIGQASFNITSKWLLANPQAKDVFLELQNKLSKFEGAFSVDISEQSGITANSPIDSSVTKVDIFDETSKCHLKGKFNGGSFTINEDFALNIRDESGTIVGKLPVEPSNWSLRDGINAMREEITPTPLDTGMPEKDNVEEPLIVNGYKRGPLVFVTNGPYGTNSLVINPSAQGFALGGGWAPGDFISEQNNDENTLTVQHADGTRSTITFQPQGSRVAFTISEAVTPEN